MIKQLLSCAVISLGGLAASAGTYDLSLDALTAGSGYSYSAETKTITFESAWSCAGWWLDSFDASAYDNVVVEIAANEATVQVVVEYSDNTNGTAQGQAGETKLILPLDQDKKSDIKQVYLQNSVANQSVTLVAAYFESAGEVAWEPVKWEGSQEFDDSWGSSIQIPAAKFIGLEENDVLKVTYTIGDEWGSLKLATAADGWPALTSNADEVNQWGCIELKESGEYSMAINAADVTSLTTTGLIVQGAKFTVTKVEVIKENAPATTPEHLYIFGQIDGNGFDPANSFEMTKSGDSFSYTGTIDNADNGYGYVGFAEIQSSDRTEINAARWAGGKDEEITVDGTATLTKGVDASFKLVAEATYTFTVTFADGGATLTVTGDDSIADINADAAAPAVYYDLNGRRVNEANLANGVYVRVQGTTTTKILVK